MQVLLGLVAAGLGLCNLIWQKKMSHEIRQYLGLVFHATRQFKGKQRHRNGSVLFGSITQDQALVVGDA